MAYQRASDAGNWQEIYRVTLNPGEDPTQVTSQTTTYDSDPDVSPDYSKVAFLRDDGGGTLTLRVCNANGSGDIELDSGNCRAPMWHPDGSVILYRIGTQVFTIQPDGSNKTDVSPDDAPVSFVGLVHPTWNRDGSFYAFHYDLASGLVADELWVCEADGTNAVKLSDATFGGLGGLGISWMKGADTMAFIERISGNNHVSIINSDGTGKTQLTNSSISPAMSKYAWASDDSVLIVPQADASPWTIYSVSAGGGQAALSPTLNAGANVEEGIARVFDDRIYVVRDNTWDLVSTAIDGSDLRVEDDINPGDFSMYVTLAGNGSEL